MRSCVQRNPKPRRLALPGHTFADDMLTVLYEAPKRNGERYVLVRCECGTEKEVRVSDLARGATQSCGCLKHEPRSMAHARAAIGKRRAAPVDEPRRLPMARVTCSGGCTHDGEMRPGGSENGQERQAECANYNRCIDVFVLRFKGARACHCPANCTRNWAAEPLAKAAAGWAAMTWP